MGNWWKGLRIWAVVLACLLILPCAAGVASAEAVVPVPSEAYGAKADEAGLAGDAEDGYTQLYGDATEDSLNYLLRLLNFCGYAAKPMEIDGMDQAYVAYHLPTQNVVLLAYNEADKVVVLHLVDDTARILGDDEIDGLIDYYTRDLTLPSQEGSNILPQFYASIGRDGADRSFVSGDLDFLPFGDAKCWTEVYDGVEPEQILQYLSDMVLFGFDVGFRSYKNDSLSINVVLYDFDNGDAEITVKYSPDSQDASVYYKPGVSYYLLSGKEYTTAVSDR